MRIVAYLYSDPLLETAPDPAVWGWEVDRVYQDLAISKVTKVERSQWQQLLQDCQQDAIDYLLLRRLEELGESVQAVGDRLAELEALNIELITVEQSAPTEFAIGQIVPTPQADLLKLLQQLQHEQRSRRIRQGHARNRLKAAPPPGKAPYGYRRSKNRYILDRSTAPVVKDFFEQYLLYGSLSAAVRYLQKRYGKKISVSTGHRWLINPVYRGDLEYRDGDVMPDTHEAILSRDEAAQVNRLMRRNRRLPPRTASAPHSLAGLVTCAECKSPTTIIRASAPRRAKQYLYLRPTACSRQPKCKAIAYDMVLQAVIARICEDLPRAVSGAPLPDLERIKQGISGAIAGKQAILNQLPDLVTSGVLDQETADLRSYKVRTEIAELQSQLTQLPPANLIAIAQTVSLPQFWLDLSEAERRFYFREFIKQIDFTPNGLEWQLKLVFIF